MNNQIDKQIADKMLALPDSREQLEMIQDLQSLERSVETLGDEMTKPSDLLNIPVDILDGWATEITDSGQPKRVSVFRVRVKSDGAIHTLMQTETSPRKQITDFFGKFRAIGVEKQLDDYQLVEGKDNGQPNRPLIWARAPKAIPARKK